MPSKRSYKAIIKRYTLENRCLTCGRQKDTNTTRCSICKEKGRVFAIEKYHRLKKKGICTTCRKRKANNGILCKECKKYHSSYCKQYNLSLKNKILDAYGRFCSCCKEQDERFLTIDHVNGGGYRQRKQYKNSRSSMLRDIVKQGFPETFQILCYNCNCARQFFNGVCPHKLPKLT